MIYYQYHSFWKKKFAFLPVAIEWMNPFPTKTVWLQTYWVRHRYDTKAQVIVHEYLLEAPKATEDD